ncbi:acyl-CoA dehydrogenase family protein, partial [Pseudomonas aeruginosa]
NLGMQVYGGHGYIRKNGMEQIVSDVRIANLYEGTTRIQARDLPGCKVLLKTQGKAVGDSTRGVARSAVDLLKNVPRMRGRA